MSFFVHCTRLLVSGYEFRDARGLNEAVLELLRGVDVGRDGFIKVGRHFGSLLLPLQ